MTQQIVQLQEENDLLKAMVNQKVENQGLRLECLLNNKEEGDFLLSFLNSKVNFPVQHVEIKEGERPSLIVEAKDPRVFFSMGQAHGSYLALTQFKQATEPQNTTNHEK